MTTDAFFYRKILFSNDDTTWGYPLPHLLSMSFKRDAHGGEDQIKLFFSTGTVSILGRSLVKLWERLADNSVSTISEGDSPAGDYHVREISPPKDLPEVGA